jgi:hypothetical protein
MKQFPKEKCFREAAVFRVREFLRPDFLASRVIISNFAGRLFPVSASIGCRRLLLAF